MELCVEEAAVTGDYGTLLQAFIINPQIVAGTKAKRIMDELLIAHKKYLPQFADTIARLEEEGVTIKDDVARELTEKGLWRLYQALMSLFSYAIMDFRRTEVMIKEIEG